MMKSDKGFRCKDDRAKDAEMDKHYREIGIKSIQAASTLIRSGKAQAKPTSNVSIKH